MIAYSFGNSAFNKQYGESTIEMIIEGKAKYGTPESFFNNAIRHLDEAIYTGYNVAEDYVGAYLRDGDYREIVQKWLSSMDDKVEINISSIKSIRRVMRVTPDPYSDEFLIETDDEYILLLWTTSA